MKSYSSNILRVGVGITFLWIGLLIFKDPTLWGDYLQDWAVALVPVSTKTAMMATAALDILIGFLLIVNLYTWIIATVAAIHMFVVLVSSGITAITIRDIPILVASIALAIEFWPNDVNLIKSKPKQKGNDE